MTNTDNIVPIHNKYNEAVIEGKAIVRRTRTDLWRLAEIAHSIESEYGEQTLERFAEDIGLSYEAIMKYRAVYERFGQIPQNCRRLPFWTLAELVAVPNAEKIIEEKPDITVREARSIAKEEKARKPPDRSNWHSCSTNPISLPTSLQESRINHAVGSLLGLSYGDLKVMVQRIQKEEPKLWEWLQKLMKQ